MHTIANQTGAYWSKALPELQQVSKALETLAKKPDDATLIRRTLNVVDRATPISVWVKKVFPPDRIASLNVILREVHAQVKSRTLDVNVSKSTLARYKSFLQNTLDDTAPAHFTQEGFRFDNPEHMPWSVCRIAIEGFAFLKTMFKKRGVVSLLEIGVRRVILVPTEGMTAHFDSSNQEMTVSTADLNKMGRFSESFAGETVIHEFGHYLHRNFITGEAAEAWNAPWQGVPSLADPLNRHLRDNPDRIRKIEPLDIVTEYGKTDQYEDFAETFLLFMLTPENLSPTAKFRMQRTLALTGLYGKPVMRMGADPTRVAAKHMTILRSS